MTAISQLMNNQGYEDFRKNVQQLFQMDHHSLSFQQEEPNQQPISKLHQPQQKQQQPIDHPSIIKLQLDCLSDEKINLKQMKMKNRYNSQNVIQLQQKKGFFDNDSTGLKQKRMIDVLFEISEPDNEGMPSNEKQASILSKSKQSKEEEDVGYQKQWRLIHATYQIQDPIDAYIQERMQPKTNAQIHQQLKEQTKQNNNKTIIILDNEFPSTPQLLLSNSQPSADHQIIDLIHHIEEDLHFINESERTVSAHQLMNIKQQMKQEQKIITPEVDHSFKQNAKILTKTINSTIKEVNLLLKELKGNNHNRLQSTPNQRSIHKNPIQKFISKRPSNHDNELQLKRRSVIDNKPEVIDLYNSECIGSPIQKLLSFQQQMQSRQLKREQLAGLFNSLDNLRQESQIISVHSSKEKTLKDLFFTLQSPPQPQPIPISSKSNDRPEITINIPQLEPIEPDIKVEWHLVNPQKPSPQQQSQRNKGSSMNMPIDLEMEDLFYYPEPQSHQMIISEDGVEEEEGTMVQRLMSLSKSKRLVKMDKRSYRNIKEEIEGHIEVLSNKDIDGKQSYWWKVSGATIILPFKEAQEKLPFIYLWLSQQYSPFISHCTQIEIQQHLKHIEQTQCQQKQLDRDLSKICHNNIEKQTFQTQNRNRIKIAKIFKIFKEVLCAKYLSYRMLREDKDKVVVSNVEGEVEEIPLIRQEQGHGKEISSITNDSPLQQCIPLDQPQEPIYIITSISESQLNKIKKIPTNNHKEIQITFKLLKEKPQPSITAPKGHNEKGL